MRRIITWVSVYFLVFWSVLIPKHTQAVKIMYKCEELDTNYWTPSLAQAYAKLISSSYGWNRSEYKALVKLWNAESNWNPLAYNKDPDLWSHRNAGGIPQLLGMNPLTTPAPLQIERGLAYIKDRYTKPSIAWHWHRVHGWY